MLWVFVLAPTIKHALRQTVYRTILSGHGTSKALQTLLGLPVVFKKEISFTTKLFLSALQGFLRHYCLSKSKISTSVSANGHLPASAALTFASQQTAEQDTSRPTYCAFADTLMMCGCDGGRWMDKLVPRSERRTLKNTEDIYNSKT